MSYPPVEHPYANGPAPLFPPFVGQPGFQPVVPMMSGAMPTTGNPFPAPPMNMPVPEPAPPGGSMGGMGGMGPDAPVIPPLPHSMRHGRPGGTPFVAAGQWGPDSPTSSDDPDWLDAGRRERLQPPLAPGQYGPFDNMRDRARPAGPALRRGEHRRAASSPAFRVHASQQSDDLDSPSPIIPQVVPPPPVIPSGIPPPNFVPFPGQPGMMPMPGADPMGFPMGQPGMPMPAHLPMQMPQPQKF